jgi:hypothetical protein
VACILAAARALLATVSASARVDRFVAAIKADGRLAKAAERYGLEPIVVHE